MLSPPSNLTLLDWVQANWGNLASLAGLLLTFYVMLVTRGARAAAIAARNAAEQRTAASDLRACGERTAFLRILCDTQRWEVATHLADQVVQDLTFMQARWANHFEPGTAKSLTKALTQANSITGQLRRFQQATPTGAEIELLAAALQFVGRLLAAEVGKHELALSVTQETGHTKKPKRRP